MPARPASRIFNPPQSFSALCWLVLVACAIAAAAAASRAIAQSAPSPLALEPPAGHARGDISGDWQGTYTSSDGVAREVLRISKLADGEWQTLWYQIDRNGIPHFAPFTTLQGSDFKFEFPPANVSYSGKLSADGNTIAGTWTAGKNPPSQVVFVRAAKETAWEIPPLPAQPKQMAADADPSFSVATVKPSDPSSAPPRFLGPRSGMNYRSTGRTFTESDTSLADIIQWAYGIHEKQLIGAPDWIKKNHYDISGVQDGEGMPSTRQWRTMMQKLLADRFQLAVHHETRVLPVYLLTQGPALKGLAKSFPGEMGMEMTKIQPGRVTLSGTNQSIAGFATGPLQGFLKDRPVLDKTGVTGNYDFSIFFAPDSASPEAQFSGSSKSDDIPAPDLFTAVQKQLGLKLEAVKAPVDVVVVDRIQPPSAN